MISATKAALRLRHRTWTLTYRQNNSELTNSTNLFVLLLNVCVYSHYCVVLLNLHIAQSVRAWKECTTPYQCFLFKPQSVRRL